MARLTDLEILTCYRNALANWLYDGFVKYSPLAEEWLQKRTGVTPREFSRFIHDFVRAGGQVDQIRETRPEWTVHDFHYDLRFTLNGNDLYVETRLEYKDPSDPDDSMITVVNIHLA